MGLVQATAFDRSRPGGLGDAVGRAGRFRDVGPGHGQRAGAEIDPAELDDETRDKLLAVHES